jgi:TRAP-type C4-dicarboxylate transport system substrate-binding protein
MLRSLLLLSLSVASLASAAESVVLKLGTAVPRESPWGAVLRVWAKAVKEKTKEEVTIEFFWNATQGDEAAQMSKVKTGQLDGAVVTAVGLGSIDPNVNVLPPLFQVTGTTMVPTSLAEALPELSTGNVNLMSVSALASEQMQWASRFDHVTKSVVAPNIGGMVLSKTKLDALSPSARDAVLETGRVAAKALTDRIRGEDAKAMDRLSKRMTVVEFSDDDLKAWVVVFKEARVRLGKGTFPPKLLEEVEQLAK